jgi:hypothetical protein
VQDNKAVIIRPDGDSQLFITQADHAALAARIMHAWTRDGLARHPRRGAIFFAVAEHDNGWVEEDGSTLVDEAGRPLDFVAAPARVKHRIWPRAVARVAPHHRYEAALIAQHALTVHASHRAEEPWRGFFDTMERLRTELLEGAAGSAFERDYRFVRTADLLSLVFCNGWTDPHELPCGGRALLDGSTLQVSPDPFGGARVPLRVAARRLPRQRYRSAAELRAALAHAAIEPIEGAAVGV